MAKRPNPAMHTKSAYRWPIFRLKIVAILWGTKKPSSHADVMLFHYFKGYYGNFIGNLSASGPQRSVNANIINCSKIRRGRPMPFVFNGKRGIDYFINSLSLTKILLIYNKKQ